MANETNGRTLASVVYELKDELKEFIQTRAQIFSSEMQEKISGIKAGGPLLAVALTFFGTAYLLFTSALVALIVVAFYDNPYRWFLACIIVAVLWSICGAFCFFAGKKELTRRGIVPAKTIQILKEDQLWLEKEARSQA